MISVPPRLTGLCVLTLLAVTRPVGAVPDDDAAADGVTVGTPATQEATATPESVVVQPDWSLGDHCHPDFFFAKAFHCRGDRGSCMRGCRLHYERYRNGCARTSSEGEFLGSLQPGVPVCVVVHGSFVPNNARTEFVRVYQWIRAAAPEQPLHVVFYRWPSDSGCRIAFLQLEICRLAKLAEYHGFHLARFMSSISAEHPVSLIAHSHGARTAASALHLLGGGRVRDMRLQCRTVPRRYRVVFGAAAIDHDWLNPGEKYGRALCATEVLVNLRSRKDWVLKLYPHRKPFSPHALGSEGFTRSDRSRLARFGCRIREIDVTRLVGKEHMVAAYRRHPSIARAVVSYLSFADQAPARASVAAGSSPSNRNARLSARSVEAVKN